jgi:DNA-binding MarR family transcriptional regulator
MYYDQLKLENQLCFPVYAASRLITRAYKPHLEALGLTYPQYLVLMVLWEEEEMTVNSIAQRLILNTNTLTPLLKRMEQNGLLRRDRSQKDERNVIVTLSEKGKGLREEAALVPKALIDEINSVDISIDELSSLKKTLKKLIRQLE